MQEGVLQSPLVQVLGRTGKRERRGREEEDRGRKRMEEQKETSHKCETFKKMNIKSNDIINDIIKVNNININKNTQSNINTVPATAPSYSAHMHAPRRIHTGTKAHTGIILRTFKMSARTEAASPLAMRARSACLEAELYGQRRRRR